MTNLTNLAEKLERISEMTGRGIAWLSIFMVIVAFTVVVARYVFNTGWIAVQELVTYLHSFIFMLGAAYTLKHEGHVRVDIFYRKMSFRRKAMVDMGGIVFLLLPVCLFILWSSWDYVGSSWKLLEGSQETDGLPLVFLLKTAIPLMCLLLILQGIAQFIRAYLCWQNGAEPDSGSGPDNRSGSAHG